MRLRKLYKRIWNKIFGVGHWQGASEGWSPIKSSTRAGQSDAFDELDILDAFDRIIADLKEEPKWLSDFKAKTQEVQARIEWDRKYANLLTSTAYTLEHVRRLNNVLAA